MKSFPIFLAVFLVILFCGCEPSHQEFHPLSESPGPSDLDDPLKDSLKQVFLDELYFAAAGLNVDSVRYANRIKNQKIKRERRAEAHLRNGSELFADGAIEAIWHERGPNNEAGDIRVVDYLAASDAIYAISSVGHLWKGSTAGNDWVLLNDDIQLHTDFIKVLPHNGGTRIFAAYGEGKDNKIIRYSDDEGRTWTKGTGFDFYDHWGRGRRLYSLSDGNTLYYLVRTWSASPWGQLMQIYQSSDKGQTYTQVLETSTGAYNKNTMDMWKPFDSDALFVLDNVSQEYLEISHDFATGNAALSTPLSYASENVASGGLHLSGRLNADASDYDLFIYTGADDKTYRTDNGTDWTFLSTASDNVWVKGWLADPDNDNLYVGSFQLNKTSNLVNWGEQYAQWWEYYQSSKDFMHVDIMSLDYFRKTDGTPFILICNHAGVHITYDNFQSTQNLGLTTLNVTTLYDQTTAADGFLYCGAQDKGTFVYNGNSQADFTQLATMHATTGDGMLGSFFNSDLSYYGMIQNGAFACVPDRTSSSKSWYTIPGNHKSGWINPMVATPDFSDNKAYMAGGNLNGGNGCYLIEMDVNISGSGVSFIPSQFNYDFRANSNSTSAVIKAIGVNATDEDRLYVATQDATFFYSEDRGLSWTKSSVALPGNLLPWEIISSPTDPDKVFISGTGFSNPGVYQSLDGGESFSPLSGDIPSATFYEVALSDQEDYLYAATSEGPYVYVFSEGLWYNLLGADSPVLDYTSVDNIGNATIRFGTYGRGIWDLELVAALPVDLVRFEAETKPEDGVELTWLTRSELNTAGFTIERKSERSGFEEIGEVPSAGGTSDQAYKFIDSAPEAGNNYYRLRIESTDGSYQYSETRSVEINRAEGLFTLYPNLLSPGETIQISTREAATYELQIFDLRGKTVFAKKALQGNTHLSLPLSAGQYFYAIQVNGSQTTEKGRLVFK